jgi:DNA-directed RNA polymerase subunit H (RpoH/RPB5)
MESANTIYRSFNVLKEMLADQGFDISNLEHVDKNELDLLIRQSDNIFQIDVSKSVKIIYYLNAKFKINNLRTFLSSPPDGEQSNITDIILIFKEKINNFNSKNVEEFKNKNLQVFLMKELCFNVSKHELVPHHEIVSDPNEMKSLIEKHNLKNKLQFPIILKTDPMARYLNVQSGHLVKITRTSPTAGESVVYRCCV